MKKLGKHMSRILTRPAKEKNGRTLHSYLKRVLVLFDKM